MNSLEDIDVSGFNVLEQEDDGYYTEGRRFFVSKEGSKWAIKLGPGALLSDRQLVFPEEGFKRMAFALTWLTRNAHHE